MVRRNASTSEARSSSTPPPNTEPESFALLLLEALKDPSVTQRLELITKPDHQRIADEVEARMTKIIRRYEEDLAAKSREIVALQHRVEELEARSDDQEQYSRRTSVRISGVKEEQGEDVEAVTRAIFAQLDVQPSINRVHRVGRKEQGSTKPRSILCQFASHPDKGMVMRKRKDLKAVRPNTYLNEDLTRARAKLLYSARLLKRSRKIQDTWSADGRIGIKDLNNRIYYVTRQNELTKFN